MGLVGALSNPRSRIGYDNHALNSRLNEEFRKYFPTSEYVPILRNLETGRYWINEGLLRVAMSWAQEINIGLRDKNH
jgi:hypothetical protein